MPKIAIWVYAYRSLCEKICEQMFMSYVSKWTRVQRLALLFALLVGLPAAGPSTTDILVAPRTAVESP